MTENIQLEYDAFLRSFKRNVDVPHSFLLGAGASISSGIQSAYDCIWEWKKDIYLSKNINSAEFYKNYKNESVRKSIQNWLDNQGEYPPIDSPNEYSFYAEKAYPIADDRRKYFFSLIENKEPYIGYKLLCTLAEHNIVKSVWTTNFDGLIVRSAHQNKLTPIEVTLDNADRIYRNQSSKELLTIALHGDYKFSTLKNTEKELDNQNDTFIEHFSNYHIDKNLIVLGYSGRDKSLMDAIFMAFSKKGSGRLYWCGFGDQINKEVSDLISKIRKSGREAYYISTDGFDKTLIHLSKSAFEGNSEIEQQIQKALESSKDEEYFKTEFSLNIKKTDKYIKSNLHAVTFPKEVFQFEIDYKDERPWSFLKEITKETSICAVPFKGKVYAIGTLTDIDKVFKAHLKTEIKREPISKYDVENVSAFQSLMLKAVLKYIVNKYEIDTNFKGKIWLKSIVGKYDEINIHKALFLSFYFDKNSKFAYLSFVPAVHLTSNNEISKQHKQSISKGQLEKLYNNKYDELLSFWNGIIFPERNLKFEYPEKSGTGFEFQISSNTAFGEINVLDPNFRTYNPNNYNKRQTQFRGVQFLEPQLMFRNVASDIEFKDYHPMRGLVNNRPFDVNLNGLVYSTEVNLTVICGRNYADKLFDFLSELNSKHAPENNNSDYLIEYPGFLSTYNLPINIPNADNSEKWVDINFKADSVEENHTNALKLARLITSRIEQLANTQSVGPVVIFIPNEWQPFENYTNQGETFDLHDYVKAFSASKGVTTQLIREETLDDKLKCQIYWWLSLSFYVKSLRTPWLLYGQEKNTAYAGIGYSISHRGDKSEIVIGCSHIYDSNGQGLKYRLSKIDNYFLDNQNNPYLSFKEAFQFGVSIHELFYQSMDKVPERVVIHKRTKFTEDEINGIKASLNKAGIKKIDLIEINYEADARFLAMSVYQNNLQIDKFPISRGTCIVTNKHTALLWTHGIVPSVRQPNYKFYLGGRSIPAPIKIIKHYGESNIDIIAREILGLTKMNWNSLDLYSKLPATIDSSNQIARIGKLLSRFEGKSYDYRLFI
ncbi:SIR2 family protein [Parapedobacter koreensis]|uniref:Protein argonaute n=1 Tax=Parapedobacter koreensis TaxID=332977 RepID=A0A1H7IA61_9SPHI|nr:SIR2 family protein [Parapedobacter koreensis]SEK59244.1 SIR2-like domain-containing protein [Parapedobacter koreensis]